jgi:two-component system sensor histidine kinase SenX3
MVARLPLGVIVVSKLGLDVVYANTAARRLTHPAAIRRGQPPPDLWGAFSLEAYASQLFAPAVAPDEIVSRDGRTVAIRGLTARGSDMATILLEDVSARERRRRAEHEFVANAAHELLTPLTGITGAAHVLEAGAKDVPEDRDRFIAHIAQECDRLARIARSLLVLARAQSGEQPPRLEVVPLCDVLDDLVGTVTAETAIDVRVDCPRELRVLVDNDLLVQALTNLVVNAARHGTGTVTITAMRSDMKRVGIVVDDGATRGPAGEQLSRLGERFFTAAGMDGGGFGLGMSIARQSIEALGGTLTLDVPEGGGLSVRIEVLAGGSPQ